MSLSGEWLNEPRYIHILLNNKKEQTIDTTFWMDLKEIAWSGKMPQLKGHMPSDSICMTVMKWWNYRNGGERSGYEVLGAWERGRREEYLAGNAQQEGRGPSGLMEVLHPDRWWYYCDELWLCNMLPLGNSGKET